MECSKDAALVAKEAAERKFETMTTIFKHSTSRARKRKQNVGLETSAVHHNVHMPFQANEAPMPQTENVHAVQTENQDGSSARNIQWSPVCVAGESILASSNTGATEFQHVNGGCNGKLQPPTNISLSKSFRKDEMRKLLIKKAKSGLTEKLRKNRTNKNDSGTNTDAEKEEDHPSTYIVPDPHFHDFDNDCTEESFQSGQVWASYGDKDGMPHSYVLIKKRLSLSPFKLGINFFSTAQGRAMNLGLSIGFLLI